MKTTKAIRAVKTAKAIKTTQRDLKAATQRIFKAADAALIRVGDAAKARERKRTVQAALRVAGRAAMVAGTTAIAVIAVRAARGRKVTA